MLFLLATHIAQAISLDISYNFGLIYGQVFNDVKGSYNTAVNGDTYLPDPNDVTPTDRGAFFSISTSKITLPPNTNSTSCINFLQTHTVAMWVLVLDIEGVLLARSKDSTNFLYIYRKMNTKSVAFRLMLNGMDTGILNGLSGNFQKESWVLISYSVNINAIKVYINGMTEISHNYLTTYSETGCYSAYLGSRFLSTSAIIGYMWYYYYSPSVLPQSTFFSTQNGISCITTGCSTCTYKIIDAYYTNPGCLPTHLSPNVDNKQNPCPSGCNVGCLDGICLSCSCQDLYCTSDPTPKCWCPSTALATAISCTCPNGQYYDSIKCMPCDTQCSTCSATALNCITCVASNSVATSNGCVCASGYYAISPMSNASACVVCGNECAGCLSNGNCISCVSSNATPNTNKGCYCNAGYFGTAPLSTSLSCSACYQECSSCIQALKCLTCISSNASPDSLQGCNCNARYYGNAPLVSSSSCVACHIECATCNQANLCLTCVSSNAVPSVTQGCICNSNYYGTAPLITSYSCTACYIECATCNQDLKCLTCISLNASPSAIQGCTCNSRFYGTAPLITSYSCAACYIECATCNQALKCLSCISLNASPSAVQGCTCNSRYYGTAPLSYSSSCLACYAECASCTQSLKCLTCISSNASPDSIQGCTCNIGYGGVAPLNTAGSCFLCALDCMTCNSPTVCITCKDSYAVPGVQGCVCISGYFQSSTNPLVCSPCNNQCSSCSASNPNICLTCVTGLAIPNAGEGCQCSTGSYATGPLTVASACQLCFDECLTCTSYPMCTSCKASQAIISSTAGCKCIDGTYATSSILNTASSCQACHQECSLCAVANLCSSCKAVMAEPDASQGCRCIQGYYGTNLLASNSCTACHIDCLTCTQMHLCTVCKSSDAYPSTIAGCICNDGYYFDSNRMCQACNIDCLACSSRDSCSSCIDGNAHPGEVGCDCDQGYYKNANNICAQCDISCLTCSGPNSCTLCRDPHAQLSEVGCSCEPNFGLNAIGDCAPCNSDCIGCSTVNVCLECNSNYAIPSSQPGCECIAGYYFDLNRDCQHCNSNCQTCDEPNKCLTCIKANTTPSPIEGCECISGYYYDEGLICQTCNSDCSTCNNANSCTQCKDLNADIGEVGCVCKTGYFRNLSNQCQVCNSDCSACDQENICIACKNSNTVISNSLGCDCSPGYFYDANRICQPCNRDCRTCDNPNTCIACNQETSIISAVAGCDCLAGYYYDSARVCQPCNPDCSACDNANTCITCKYENTLVSDISGCDCTPGLFYDAERLCQPCHNDCLTCSTQNLCVTCKDVNAIASTVGCNCKSGYYYDANRVCQACNLDCLTCSSQDLCTACKGTNTIISSTIGCDCASGFFYDSRHTCQPCNSDCLTCDNPNTCLLCKGANTIINTSSGCDCIRAYFYDSNRICQPCSGNCSNGVCTNDGSCAACNDPNAIPVPVMGCQCASGYHMSANGACVSCPAYCTCGFNGECNACVDPNASLSNSTCSCKLGYFNNASTHTCFPCNNTCASCTGPSAYDCISCASLMLNGTCIDKCPLGFSNINNICIIEDGTKPIIRFRFTEVGSVFHDEIHKLVAKVDSTKKRSLGTASLPITAYMRGVYFPGGGKLTVNFNNTKLLGTQFSFSMWINPEVGSGVIVEKSDSNKTSIRIGLENLRPYAIVYVEGKHYTANSSSALLLNQWSQILVNFEKQGNYVMSVVLNSNTGAFTDIGPNPFVDSDQSLLIIGADSTEGNLYQGFIYLIEAYATPMSPASFASTSNCTGCNICPLNSKCIPTCSITQYYSPAQNMCIDCPNNCSTACKSGTDCNLCADNYCVACSSFFVNSCTDCIDGYQVVNSTCSPCDLSAYFDVNSRACLKCPGICLTCTAQNACTSCAENSSIENGVCVCDKGFTLNELCERNHFGVIFSVSSGNDVTLLFDEDLSQGLKESDISCSIEGASITVAITEINKNEFKLTPSFGDIQLSAQTYLNIKFESSLISTNNSLLSEKSLTVKLFITEDLISEQSTKAKAKSAKTMATQGAATGAGVAIGLSLLTFNPTSFFNFINTSEMFFSVYLFNIRLHPILSNFLLGMRLQGFIPNIFSYAFDEDQGIALSLKYSYYGYSTNLMLLNSGTQIMSLIWFLLQLLILMLLARNNWCKMKLKKILRSFRYAVFLRLWVQCFFEMLSSAAVSVRYSKLANAVQIIDFALSILVMIVQGFGVAAMVYALWRRRKIRDDYLAEEFKISFSTLFEEFKDSGLSNWLFYALYIFRRIAIVLCYEFIEYGPLQISVSIGFSIIIPLYILTTRSFDSKAANVYQFFNELLIGCFNCTIFVSLLTGSAYTSEDAGYLCIYFIVASLVLNFLYSIYTTITDLVTKIRNFLKKRREARLSRIYRVQTVPETDLKVEKTEEL